MVATQPKSVDIPKILYMEKFLSETSTFYEYPMKILIVFNERLAVRRDDCLIRGPGG